MTFAACTAWVSFNPSSGRNSSGATASRRRRDEELEFQSVFWSE